MIDLHSHVLPGIDDGPADDDGALALARAAYAGGTRIMVATPHLDSRFPAVRLDELADRVADLNDLLWREGVGLEVRSGAELPLATALDLDDAELRRASLGANGRDLLLEPPDQALPATFDSLVADLARRGFRPVIGHPERCRSFQEDPARLGALVAAGALCQITARTLARAPRRAPTRRTAVHALREGWVHAIASDAHETGERGPELERGVRMAAKILGGSARAARWLVTVAPAAILVGAPLPPRPAG